MSEKLFIEGFENDIAVNSVKRPLELLNRYEMTVNEGNRDDIRTPEYIKKTMRKMEQEDPDGIIICNIGSNREYVNFLTRLQKNTKLSPKALMIMTGGGPDVEAIGKEYTDHVVPVPYEDGFTTLYSAVAKMLNPSYKPKLNN